MSGVSLFNFLKLSTLHTVSANALYYHIISLSATLFVEIWKRRQSVLAWEWDLEMDDQEEQPRPEFEVGKHYSQLSSLFSQAEVRTRRINPVTKYPEAYLPGYSKLGRIALTTSFVLFLVFIVKFILMCLSVTTRPHSAVLRDHLPGRHHPVQDHPPRLDLQGTRQR